MESRVQDLLDELSIILSNFFCVARLKLLKLLR